ncbi:DUF202 domain-containing protein [Catellatospora tritici]|uniref:DUF202 domain-containing protein n=1 Tax=Catellatospora tritici TaxID=2851566 RepID=UPI001C2D90CB|nr:DUF202 domain-containing protein [Catellatospora tritici]MBV1856281.1 DUF202 domain-containing protein [Catellatospora tritici]
MARIRMWLEAGLAAAAAGLAVLTLFIPDWIERFFDAKPDSGEGEVEWLLAALFAAAAAVLALLARRDWRRLHAAADH